MAAPYILGSTCADLGSSWGLGAGAGAMRQFGNFLKSRVRVRQDTFINKLLYISIYFLYIAKHIFSYNGKHIPI